MKIKYKDTSSMQGRAKIKPLAQVPISCPPSSSELSPFNIYQERPFKTNSSNLSFKGLSSYGKIDSAIDKFGSVLGKTAKTELEILLNRAHNFEKSGLVWDKANNAVLINEKSMGQRFIEVLKYPFKDMFLDIGNSFVNMVQKISGLKKTKLAKSLLDVKSLKNRREALDVESNVFAFNNYFKQVNDKDFDIFAASQSMFDPLKSKYDSTLERTFTRIVTGLIPAFFLANDAYNLSIYMNNNKDLASKEKKRRFNQEIARIAMTASATFGVMKLFSKSSNANPNVATYLITGVCLISEIIGRKLAGNPVLPVSQKEAIKYAEKQGKLKKKDAELNEPKFQAKKEKKIKNPPQKGGLTFTNALKVLVGFYAVGFATEKFRKHPSIEPLLNKFNNAYKRTYKVDYKISKTEFDEIKDKLKINGFDDIANKYQKIVDKVVEKGNLTQKENDLVSGKTNDYIAKNIAEFKNSNKDVSNTDLKDKIKDIEKDMKSLDNRKKIMKELNIEPRTDEVINIGSKQNKTRTLLIHNIATFPIRYTWNSIVMLPYNFVTKAIKIVKEIITKEKKIELKKVREEEMLQHSIEFLKKVLNKSDFKTEVNKNIIGSFDLATKSSYSNAQLSSAVKNSSSAVTSVFLVADNYNMAMIDSNGQDKDFAEQKAKERTIQRGVRLAYGAMLIKFFNSAFAKTYNGSLLGAQTLNTSQTILTEMMERTSVGLPLNESTPEKIKQMEKEHLEASGLEGGYYRLMAKLTGKKAFSESKAVKTSK